MISKTSTVYDVISLLMRYRNSFNVESTSKYQAFWNQCSIAIVLFLNQAANIKLLRTNTLSQQF
ncbi:MAG: hypothetical protein MJK14_05645 [Rivularia sp. ALOHA_DT_140]|nr:hypothetical protein [Rivularia sp. ALOHA_DT_140]